MKVEDRLMKLLGEQARKPSGWLGKILFGHMAALGHSPLTQWGIKFMDIQPTDNVLDIGCGGGMAIKLIAQIATEGFVAGVDYSEDMVQQARKRNKAAVLAGHVEIRRSDVMSLPYDDESFDKVIAIETFYFWPAPVANLREVCRVIQPGGMVALVMEGSKESRNLRKTTKMTDQIGIPIYNGAELVEMLTTAGFSRAWFESLSDKGMGWLCDLGIK